MFFSETNLLSSFKLFLLILFTVNVNAQTDWYERESEHFKVIFRGTHQHLVPHIVNSAESAYKVLARVFKYAPSSKIIINTYDINDYGFGAATSVPENFIRLEIEPFEPGYENTPYNERFQWVLSHELVHIFVNDGASNLEKINRSLFGRVAPVQIQPLSILYSLTGNYSRYTPRWHQEALAVFLETWLSGGFGRLLGSFDEMYFRTLAADSISFPTSRELETISSHNSFLLETLFYLYGGRFAAYLSLRYGSEKLIQWFKVEPGDVYPSFSKKFKKIFNSSFDYEWENFIRYELEFQKENIKRLESAGLTDLTRLSGKPLGWITQPYYVSKDSAIMFANHRSHDLAGINIMKLKEKSFSELLSLPTPSMFQVASTAFDSSLGLFFYTTNNNHLYRDIWVYDIVANESKIIYPDSRIGQLTVSSATHELWGIQHWGGRASLVYSVYPYSKFFNITDFPIGFEIINLSVSPSGKILSAVIHETTGEQKLVWVDVKKLKENKDFLYNVISTKGEPDNPSWSSHENTLLWNAYTNGVSNIYSFNFETAEINAVTNTVRGLFKPIFLNNDTIFAFEFSSEGFYPVLLKNEPADFLPAIEYLGQRIIEKEEQLAGLSVTYNETAALSNINEEKKYSSRTNIKVETFIPVITGFQNQKALGFFIHLADPLINHDITAEIAYSPFENNSQKPKFHAKLKYDYMKKYELSVDHNASDFYDLFNDRKRGMIGTKLRAGHIHYWLYDNPLKIVQKTEAAVYTGVKFINDNLVSVSEPDFFVAQTVWNSKNLRRTIGSSDFEHGEEYNITLMLFGSDPESPNYAAEIFAEWDLYRLWLFNHNVFHYKVAAGYHVKNDNLTQAKFYFGGFGNRLVENVDVKQFRSVFRFPGLPIYSLSAEKFLKLLLENNFPPIRFKNLGIGQHILNHIDFSIYSQSLLVQSYSNDFYLDLGAQLNLILKHWYNLETTLSFGAANAWSTNVNSFEWFFSIKLLKN